MKQTRRKCTCGSAHRRHGVFTCNIEALRCVLRAAHGSVQNCIPAVALVAFTWYFHDHRATRFAEKLCSTDVVESKTFTSAGARLSPIMHRLSMNSMLSNGGVAANVLLASSGVNSITRVFACATNPARKKRMCGVAFVRVDPFGAVSQELPGRPAIYAGTRTLPRQHSPPFSGLFAIQSARRGRLVQIHSRFSALGISVPVGPAVTALTVPWSSSSVRRRHRGTDDKRKRWYF